MAIQNNISNQALLTTSSPAFIAVSAGDLGASVSTPGGFQSNASTTNGSAVYVGTYANSNTPPLMNFVRSRGATTASRVAVQNGDVLGATEFLADDGTTLANNACITRSVVSGAVSTGIVPAKYEIYTTTTAGALTLGMTLGANQVATFASQVIAPSFSPNTTSGVIGTATNDNAAAGSVGEISSSANATAVAMTTGTITQIQTLSLGAGDWDVWCTFYTTVNGATISQQIACQLHTTTATIADPTTAQLASIASAPGIEVTGQATYLSTGISRWSLSGATTVYLNAIATYSINTLTGNGMIHARRRR